MAKKVMKRSKWLAPQVDPALQLLARGEVQYLTRLCDGILQGVTRDSLLVETSGDRVASARVGVVRPLLVSAWDTLWPWDENLAKMPRGAARRRKKGGRPAGGCRLRVAHEVVALKGTGA